VIVSPKRSGYAAVTFAVIPPTGKAFDLEFGQTTKWERDQLIVISAFYDTALQRQQLGLA
jgi:hypothetical protein